MLSEVMRGAQPVTRCLLAALGVVLLSGGGCKDRKVVTCKPNEAYDPQLGECYECPKGTKVDYSSATCVPSGLPDGGGSADGGKDTVEADEVESPPPDGGPGADADQKDENGEEDLADGETAPGGEIGAACDMDSDCLEGLSCFEWDGGYCIAVPCGSAEECPGGSHCLPLLENGAACFDDCESDQECREGYGCKAIPMMTGETHLVCHPAPAEGLALGEVCDDHEQCVGDLACIGLGPVKMCTRTGCSTFSPCPDGSSCIPRGVLTLCLPDCETPEECVALGSELLECQEEEDVQEKDVTVCGPASFGLPIGNLCYFGTECETGYCHLLIAGKCSDLNANECGTDHDCEEGVCLSDPSVQKGVCSKPCGPGESCGDGSFCVQTGGLPLCLAECNNYAEACGPEGFQMYCTYGAIHYPQAPNGKYCCSKPPGGDGGSKCTKDGECSSGTCYAPEGVEGYCATGCTTDDECPFGTQCQQDSLYPGELRCTRLCFSDIDCTPGFSCKNTFYSEKACVLP